MVYRDVGRKWHSLLKAERHQRIIPEAWGEIDERKKQNKNKKLLSAVPQILSRVNFKYLNKVNILQNEMM